MLRRSVLACGFVAMFASGALAAPITVDEILYDSSTNPALLSGTVDMTYSSGVLTILLKNTSADAAGSAAGVLLTGIGFQLPTGVTLTGGAAYMGTSATAVGFTAPANRNISSEWGYDASPLHSGMFKDGAAFSYNTVVASMESMTTNQFASGSLGNPPNLGGPDFGVISALETNAGGQEAIRDTIRITLNLQGALSDIVSRIEAGNVGLSFGSPNASLTTKVPEPGSLSLLLVGVGALGAAIRRRTRQG